MVTEIAVLLAAYEGEKWLPEQLASLRAQDDPAFRVILQDDGPEGPTRAVLR